MFGFCLPMERLKDFLVPTSTVSSNDDRTRTQSSHLILQKYSSNIFIERFIDSLAVKLKTIFLVVVVFQRSSVKWSLEMLNVKDPRAEVLKFNQQKFCYSRNYMRFILKSYRQTFQRFNACLFHLTLRYIMQQPSWMNPASEQSLRRKSLIHFLIFLGVSKETKAFTFAVWSIILREPKINLRFLYY